MQMRHMKLRISLYYTWYTTLSITMRWTHSVEDWAEMRTMPQALLRVE
jgi:hypothetical protein